MQLGTSEKVIIAGALGAVGAAVAALHVENLETFIAFAILIAVASLLEVTLPNEVPFSLGMAPGLGFALLGTRSVPEIIAVFAAGKVACIVLRMVLRREVRVPDLATHLLAVAGAAALYHAIARIPNLPTFDAQETVISAFGFAAMLFTVVFVQAALQSARTVERTRLPFTPAFVGRVRSTAALHVSILSVGALLALTYPSLGYWSFPLFLAPLAATQFAFRQFASIRKTYLQTIRALSKVPEMAGYTRPGHSSRVAGLSMAIAQELSVDERDLPEVEYAALMHDIGRISMSEPNESAAQYGRTELAIVGATIVRETGHFPRVAEMIQRQYDRYRRPGEESNPSLPIGARIIKVASAFDDLTSLDGVGLSEVDALERLYDGMKYEYDPNVVQGLVRVIEKRPRAKRIL